jgi:hypothetical protein
MDVDDDENGGQRKVVKPPRGRKGKESIRLQIETEPSLAIEIDSDDKDEGVLLAKRKATTQIIK